MAFPPMHIEDVAKCIAAAILPPLFTRIDALHATVQDVQSRLMRFENDIAAERRRSRLHDVHGLRRTHVTPERLWMQVDEAPVAGPSSTSRTPSNASQLSQTVVGASSLSPENPAYNGNAQPNVQHDLHSFQQAFPEDADRYADHGDSEGVVEDLLDGPAMQGSDSPQDFSPMPSTSAKEKPLRAHKRRRVLSSPKPKKSARVKVEEPDREAESLAEFNSDDVPMSPGFSPEEKFKHSFIECDNCHSWNHYACASIKTQEQTKEPYTCPQCKGAETADYLLRMRMKFDQSKCLHPNCVFANNFREASREFVVDKIVGRKPRFKEGADVPDEMKFLWLVKWEGYSMDWCNWTPEEDISDAPTLVKAFQDRAKSQGISDTTLKNARKVVLLKGAKGYKSK